MSADGHSFDRGEMMAALREGTVFDILVVGGGATGLGAAVEAASRGHSVALVEACDFAKGTSSRSTKLVHGGVRYLRQGNVSLVVEALRERGLLARNAPHLVRNLEFVIPTYKWWDGPFYGVGLKVYDGLAGSLGLGKSRILSKEETVARIPTVETEGLLGGVSSPPDSPSFPRPKVSSLATEDSPGRDGFLKALVEGREAAWEEFHRRYAHRLRAYLQALWHGPPHQLDDLLQDTLLRTVKYLKPLPDEEALWSWLTVLARSVVADHGRKQSRLGRFLRLFHQEPRPVLRDTGEELARALTRLDEDSRTLLQLKYEESRSTREIANFLSLTEKAVEGRLARARHKLRKILASPR